MPYNILHSDLVRDSKLETEVLASCLQHVFYDTGQSAHERRVRREERWVRKTFIGRGAYGSVYLEECDPGQGDKKLRAVKEIKKSVAPGDDLDYTRELEAVYWHCFVRSHGWFELDDSVFITMEYLEHGDLEQHLKSPLPEVEARQITGQVLEGLSFMHQNGFIHRDLKPGVRENIMVVTVGPGWFVKITDFGISKRRHQGVTTLLTLQRGTFGYAAPEALGFNEGEVYTSSVDMWSLGAVGYRMLTGTLAFPGPLDLFSYYKGLQKFPMASLETNGISQEGKEFITKLVNPDPKGRLTAKMAVQHPWMTIHNSANVSSTADSDTIVSVASKAWSTDSNMTIKAALPIRNPRHQPPSVVDSDTADEATKRTSEANHQPPSVTDTTDTDRTDANTAHEAPKHTGKANYHPPSVSDCPEEPLSQGPKLPPDSAILLEPANAPPDIPRTVYPRRRKEEASNRRDFPEDDAGKARKDPKVFEKPTAKPAQWAKPGYMFNKPPESTRSDGQNDLESDEDASNESWIEESSDSEGSYSSESEVVDEIVTCDECGSKFDLFTDPVECLPCKHYMCHDCLLGLVALSLVSPKYMPPRCCDDPAGLGEINPLAIPELDLDFEVKDVFTELRNFAALSRTKDWQWRCPMGHPTEDGSLLVSTGWTPVWKTPMNCSLCVVSTTLPIREDLKYREGQRYQGYCLFCCERANILECGCIEYFKLVTDSFVNSLRRRDALSQTLANKIKLGCEARDKILAGEYMQYRAWEDVPWCCELPPLKPLVDRTLRGLGGTAAGGYLTWRETPPRSQEDRFSCCRGFRSQDRMLRGLDNWEVDDWMSQLPGDLDIIQSDMPSWSDEYLSLTDDSEQSVAPNEDWQQSRSDRIKERERLKAERLMEMRATAAGLMGERYQDWQPNRSDNTRGRPLPERPRAEPYKDLTPRSRYAPAPRRRVKVAPAYTADDVQYSYGSTPIPSQGPPARWPSPPYPEYM
ncbi:protein kinase [Purpureocillium lilacinum]|uniref:Protein kinase n=1 Tax=Purpureocillium lilacinum TaxID=33203 RepID=A0A179GT54_PURLI|nr:protein kinase [Purpureocillium lilacinum]